MTRFAVMPALLIALSACARTAEPPSPPVPEPAAATSCPVLDSRNWKAALRTSASGSRELAVTGEVDLPTPGFTLHVRPGIMDRAMPPGLHLILSADPPSGMAAQVVTPHPVDFTMADALPRYRTIIIGCGDKAVATITDIAGQ